MGDFDGDGDEDIVGTTTFDRIHLLRNESNGTFVESPIAGNPSGPLLAASSLSAGDVDGDGDLDIVAGHRRYLTYYHPVYGQYLFASGAPNTVLLNDGTGGFSTGQPFGLGGIRQVHGRAQPNLPQPRERALHGERATPRGAG